MKRPLTAKEEQDILDRDPKYQAMMAEKERKRAAKEEMFEHDEAPLVEALAKVGWPKTIRQIGRSRSVWDLVNTAESYPHLLDTLTDHVVRPYHFMTRNGIARALTVREARGTRVPRVLMDELKKMTNANEYPAAGYRWSLINAIALIGDQSMTEEVRALLEDSRYASVQKDLRRLAKALQRRMGSTTGLPSGKLSKKSML